MLKDFDFKIKELPILFFVVVIVFGSAYYVGAHQVELQPILRLFGLTALDVHGILVFSLIFFLMSRLISNVLITPFVNLTEKREALTIDKISQATQDLQKAKDLEDAFYQKANEIKREAFAQKAVILSDARANAEKIIFQTENEISADITKTKEAIDEKVKNLLVELSNKREELASSLKDKILQM